MSENLFFNFMEDSDSENEITRENEITKENEMTKENEFIVNKIIEKNEMTVKNTAKAEAKCPRPSFEFLRLGIKFDATCSVGRRIRT